VPGGPVEDKQRASRAACQYLAFACGPHIRQRVLWRARPPMRPWDKSGRAIVGPEIIHHQDEAKKRPIGGVSLNVHVEFLCVRALPQRSRVERTQLEGAADDLAACLEERWKYVEVVERRATIDEIAHPDRTGRRRLQTLVRRAWPALQ
jgi:hypothetical protein